MSELQVSLQLRNLRIARGKQRLQLLILCGQARNLFRVDGRILLHLRHLLHRDIAVAIRVHEHGLDHNGDV